MAARGRLVAIEGASASGKTTLVRTAARLLGWHPLPEAFDRLDPAPTLEFGSPAELLRLEGTLLAEESCRYREARTLCRRGRTVLADTGFLGPLTYTCGLVEVGRAPASVGRVIGQATRSLLRKGTLGIPDLTIYLHTSASERAQRARSGAQGHPAALFTRHEAVGRVERRYFEEVFPAALPDRFRKLRGRAGPAGLARELAQIVGAAAPSPASRAEGLAVASLLELPARAGRRAKVGPNR